MVVKFSTRVVIRTIGRYVAVALYNDINVMFVDETDMYYLLTTKLIIDGEMLRMSRSR